MGASISRRVPTDRRPIRVRRPVIELAAYLHQHLAPHGNDQPTVWTDVLADQIADVCIHWLEHDDDGQQAAWRIAHLGLCSEGRATTNRTLAVFRAERDEAERRYTADSFKADAAHARR